MEVVLVVELEEVVDLEVALVEGTEELVVALEEESVVVVKKVEV